ncbi:hypothetical protein IMCC20628_02745 [Hoeflea sp. IMCC20628]|uniref:hypothetical protein n=1 Tax=Hoeflea sp. IMCC20628 TaxID=1620421 RepID=UPI00063AC03A|nr:hypothetical protein [Hoeflea sp. IMCC20628]AKI01441.1 hypothetical protein IMCC20628_02745 [Hoeflea sp. IMCC20628]
MALSNAERQRRHTKRKREAQKAPGDAVSNLASRPFSEFYADDANVEDFEIPLLIASIPIPDFYHDGPAEFADELKFSELPDASNSLQRAEMTVACLIDAASGLAALINKHKREEIDAQLQLHANSQPIDPVAAKAKEADIARLKKMLARLDKQVRWSFPQWKVTGD